MLLFAVGCGMPKLNVNVDGLTQLFAKHDPVGLIRMGAPVDEYEPEAKELVDVLSRSPASSADELTERVYGVFLWLFGLPGLVGPRDLYEPIATEIWRSVN